jgi:hypothetical protein
MTHSEMALTQEGRELLFKVLKTDMVLLGEAVEKDNTTYMVRDIPLMIRILNAIHIGANGQV